MIIKCKVSELLIAKRFNRLFYTQYCAFSIISTRAVNLRCYDSKNKSLILLNKSQNSFVSTIQIKRSLKGGEGYSNFAHGKKQAPSKYPILKPFVGALALGLIGLGFMIELKQNIDEDTDTVSCTIRFRGFSAASIDENKIEEKNEKKKKGKKNKSESDDENESKDEKSPTNKKKRISFKDRKVRFVQKICLTK